MEYFRKTSDFWFERCDASTCKTLEFSPEAEDLSFDYKIVWVGSEDSTEVAIDGLPADNPLYPRNGKGRDPEFQAARRQ